MSAPPRGGRGRGRSGGGGGSRYGGGHDYHYGYDDGYGSANYGYDAGYGYDEGYSTTSSSASSRHESSGHYRTSGDDGYGPPRGYRGRDDGSASSEYQGGGGASHRGRAGLGWKKPEKVEEPCDPPPIVDGYAEVGSEAMPCTGRMILGGRNRVKWPSAEIRIISTTKTLHFLQA